MCGRENLENGDKSVCAGGQMRECSVSQGPRRSFASALCPRGSEPDARTVSHDVQAVKSENTAQNTLRRPRVQRPRGQVLQ